MTNIDQFNDSALIATLEAHAHLAAKALDCSVYTVMLLNSDSTKVRRTFTSVPDTFPTSDEKPAERNSWFIQVIEGQEIFAANSPEEMGAQFKDLDKMLALGCPAVINIPVVKDEKTVAVFNLLNSGGHFTPERIEQAKSFISL